MALRKDFPEYTSSADAQEVCISPVESGRNCCRSLCAAWARNARKPVSRAAAHGDCVDIGGIGLIRVFIGFDPRETVAYNVLAHSIQARASEPVAITPLALSQLKNMLSRARDPLQSTEFSFSRFLTPCLSGYQGWSLFMDCDMLMLDDIARLWGLR